jgi:hypothetical protein
MADAAAGADRGRDGTLPEQVQAVEVNPDGHQRYAGGQLTQVQDDVSGLV